MMTLEATLSVVCSNPTCRKNFLAKKSHARYCSASCRNKVYRARKKEAEARAKFAPNVWQASDIHDIETDSERAAILLREVFAIYGSEAGDKAISAVMSYASEVYNQGYNQGWLASERGSE